jgi:superfamily II DNA or RNA helicase
MFNEGIDLPSVDRVVMLRPTESPVIFFQQLGRGLRRAGDDKDRLTVIDFVGNHRMFLERVRRLLRLARPSSTRTSPPSSTPPAPSSSPPAAPSTSSSKPRTSSAASFPAAAAKSSASTAPHAP